MDVGVGFADRTAAVVAVGFLSIYGFYMELWKFGRNELKIYITELFNKIIDKNQMPQEWETGMVIYIRKKGKKKCENYTGITLLPTAYKLFSNIKKTD